MSIEPLLQQAKAAAGAIQLLPDEQRRQLALDIAAAIVKHEQHILAANQLDLEKMDPANAMYDRLRLDAERLQSIAGATREVAALPDPCGQLLSSFTKENGLEISRITVPLGVVGAIYEARPNVTIDISALCLRSGNAVVLKGGSDAVHTNECMVQVLREVLAQHGLPEAIVTLLPAGRAFVGAFLNATRYLDVIIPRGSQGLIDFVRSTASVPVIETGAGVCHTYVEASANLTMAADIVVNAKTQRPSVCNALDTVLVDAAIAANFLPLLRPGFEPFRVGVYADQAAFSILKDAGYPHLYPATDESFGREYLSQNCSIKVVNGLEEALTHIAAYGSRHSEAIITEDAQKASQFLAAVDAAAVYHNASTRFTDGGEFGLGAELGISTQKLHARGPFALEKLVCEKWIVRGSGQIR